MKQDLDRLALAQSGLLLQSDRLGAEPVWLAQGPAGGGIGDGPLAQENYYGSSHDDHFSGSSEDDFVNGYGGSDSLSGGAGLDRLYGGNGNDALYGGLDRDMMYGGAHNDYISAVTPGDDLADGDFCSGGDGIDRLYVNYKGFVHGGGLPVAVTLDFSTGNGSAELNEGEGPSFSTMELLTFIGPDGDDAITGGAYADLIDGSGGNDILRAGAGDDIVTDSWGTIDTDGGDGIDTMILDGSVVGHEYGDTVIDGNAGTIVVGGIAMGSFVNFENLTVRAGGGNDAITGIAGGVNVFSALGGGNKTFYGQEMADRLTGGSGDDHLYGGDGDDKIGDTLGFVDAHGGTGSDTFIYTPGDTKVGVNAHAGTINSLGVGIGTFVDFENLVVTAGAQDDRITGFAGGDNEIDGGAGNDTVTGGDLADTLTGGTGNDTVYARGGNDVLDVVAQGGTDSVYAGGGDDLIAMLGDGDFAGSALAGGSGIDTLRIQTGQNLRIDLTAATVEGMEILTDWNSPSSNRTVVLTTVQFMQFQEIELDGYFVVELGDNGDVALPAFFEAYNLRLANGGQRLDMTASIEFSGSLSGGTGADYVIGSAHYDSVSGNAGNDTLYGGAEDDDLYGGSGKDLLDGGSEDDGLSGGTHSDKLYGGEGADGLYGGDGDDKLYGGDGGDYFTGGAGGDRIECGTGADTFAYAESASDSTGAAFDTIARANFDTDTFALGANVNKIDPVVSAGTLSQATFDADLAAAIGAAQLALRHAVLFNPNAGDYAGQIFLIVNLNGQAGYQANEDLVIRLDRPLNLNLDANDFD
jgi:Ca2+-binding RTX toxin-like protein